MLIPSRHHLAVILATATLTTVPAHATATEHPATAVADQQRHRDAAPAATDTPLTSLTDIFNCEDTAILWCK